MKVRALVLIVILALALVIVQSGWAPISEHKQPRKPTPVSEH